jgi:serine/threonine protein phosphatase 1
MGARTITIGDIHGCSQALDALIRAIEPQADDLIVTLGDCVNRGPDSRGVLERLIALERRCKLIALLGNHDEMLLQLLMDAKAGRPRALSSWLRMGGDTTLASYGAPPGKTTWADLARIPAEHAAFLEQCRPYYETATHIFIHANYDPVLPMDEQPFELLRWESLRDVVPGPHFSGKTVITGHSSQKTGEILDLGYLVCIDTYCCGGGWLTALDVQTQEVWQTDSQGELRPPQSG